MIAGPLRAARGASVATIVLAVALVLLAVAAVSDGPLLGVGVGAIAVGAGIVAHRELLAWRSLLTFLLLVILFIPIRRYTLPGNLPFELEPYRLVVAVLVAGWFVALLVDPRVRLARSGLEAPLGVIIFATLASIIVNPERVRAVGDVVPKNLSFLVSFLLVFWLFVSVARGAGDLDVIVKALVLGGSVVAGFTLIESRTGYNIFNHLHQVLPFLEPGELPRAGDRGARLRVYGSAQHAIALGAALVMLVPLAVYLVRRTGRRAWWGPAGLMALAAVATISRTSILMLVVVGVVYLCLRPAETRRLWPALLPALLVIHIALPGALGSFKNAFFPPGGLVAEQASGAGTRGSGRIADVGPSLQKFAKKPVVGEGYATNVTDKARQNAPILDDQWLGTLLEVGLVGALGWAWLFVRFVRRMGRAAKEDTGARGWLFTGIAASVAAYAVGMFTYDAFSFIQVTFLMFVFLGLGCAMLADNGDRSAARAAADPS